MPINMSTDKATMSAALQRAGYDLSGNDPNLIQAQLDRGSQVIALFIDAGGSVRAQITMGGGQNEQQQRSGNLQYTIIRQGQITLNVTTRLTSASDLGTLINDLNNISATRLATADAGNAATSWAHTQPQPGYSSMAQSGGGGSGRVSASNFTGSGDSGSSAQGGGSEFTRDTSGFGGHGGQQHSGSGGQQHGGTSGNQGGRVSASNFGGSDNQPSQPGGGNSGNSGNSGGRVSASDFTDEGGNGNG